jgi:hypothetical protein
MRHSLLATADMRDDHRLRKVLEKMQNWGSAIEVA